MDKDVVIRSVVGLLALVLVCCLAVFSATQEAKAFNRCNPGAKVTTWEALFAEYRIMDCKEVK